MRAVATHGWPQLRHAYGRAVRLHPSRRGVSSRTEARPTTRSAAGADVDTLIFDIDDTLYPASSGFSDHRAEEVTRKFMMDNLGFRSADEAQTLWRKYVKRYHSTLKGLAVADQEGMLPKPFRQEELGEYWAEKSDFARFIRPDANFIDALGSLRGDAGLALVAFTNAPRAYALRCLESLGVATFFPGDRIFAVEDVMPACKPEEVAFRQVLAAVGAEAGRCVMFEDSMKNIRACKAIGLHTVLIHEAAGSEDAGEAAQLGDAPRPDDPAVGAVLRNVGELRSALPGLWQRRFEPTSPPS